MKHPLATLAFFIVALCQCFQACPAQQLSTREPMPRYVLRPGDTLTLEYRLTPEYNQTVVVQPDGYISVRIAGQVHVAGLTTPAAHDLIVSQEASTLNTPELNLVLEEFTHSSIVIAGEVNRPGQMELKEHTTAMGAVLLAGGFTESAQSGQVLLFRKVDDQMAQVTRINLSSIRKTSQLDRDVQLQPGDMLLVPRDKIAKIERYLRITNMGVFFNPLQAVQ
jgi:polysaccharide export outer membrane protein